jgi:hypothetical protein
MARKTVVELFDDIDGTPAEETVVFSLDGTEYQIDLSGSHIAELRAAFAPYLGQARKAGTAKPGPAGTVKAAVADPADRATARTATDRERSVEIRAWAKQHGIVINDRGRIPAQVAEAYESKDPSLVKSSAQETVPQVTFSNG